MITDADITSLAGYPVQFRVQTLSATVVVSDVKRHHLSTRKHLQSENMPLSRPVIEHRLGISDVGGCCLCNYDRETVRSVGTGTLTLVILHVRQPCWMRSLVITKAETTATFLRLSMWM